MQSLPLRECGLKSYMRKSGLLGYSVTPLAGVWIEIDRWFCKGNMATGHSPCGSVD